jgi:hypothetical protein
MNNLHDGDLFQKPFSGSIHLNARKLSFARAQAADFGMGMKVDVTALWLPGMKGNNVFQVILIRYRFNTEF